MTDFLANLHPAHPLAASHTSLNTDGHQNLVTTFQKVFCSLECPANGLAWQANNMMTCLSTLGTTRYIPDPSNQHASGIGSPACQLQLETALSKGDNGLKLVQSRCKVDRKNISVETTGSSGASLLHSVLRTVIWPAFKYRRVSSTPLGPKVIVA